MSPKENLMPLPNRLPPGTTEPTDGTWIGDDTPRQHPEPPAQPEEAHQ